MTKRMGDLQILQTLKSEIQSSSIQIRENWVFIRGGEAPSAGFQIPDYLKFEICNLRSPHPRPPSAFRFQLQLPEPSLILGFGGKR